MRLALCALCACALSALSAANAGATHYCNELRNLSLSEKWRGGAAEELSLSEHGAPRRLRLAGGGAAARAAHELLRALLVHVLRMRADDVRLTRGAALAALVDDVDDRDHKDEFILSVAAAWGNERAATAACATRVCSVAGPRLSVLARGAAPAARRLLARLAPGAAAACLRGWQALLDASCGFLHADPDLQATTPRSCSLKNCSASECVTVVLSAHEDEQEECGLVHALAADARAGALPLRFVWLSVAELRAARNHSSQSFLFVDYEWDDDASSNVWPAPPLERAGPPPVSLVVADAPKLMLYAPAVLQLALQFRPPPAILRQLLLDRATLDPHEAACKAAINDNIRKDVRKWLACENDFCDPLPTARVFVCKGKDEYYLRINSTVYEYWQSHVSSDNNRPRMTLRVTDCSAVNAVNTDMQSLIFNFTTRARLHGVAAMGDEGASALPETARSARVPLLLTAPAAVRLGAGARSLAPPLTALADAMRALLTRCGWRRVALLREEGRCDKRKRSLGLGDALRSDSELVLDEHVVQAGGESGALDALRARDARVVLVDASAQTACAVLREAQARALTPAAGYMWLVLGAAGDTSDEDWRPEAAGFWYVTVSGGWRGGRAPAGLGGAPALRGALDALGVWSPHAAALADAMLLLLEGAARARRHRPTHRYDPQRPESAGLFFDLLSNIPGVVHDVRANASPPVFAHRWNSSGTPELVGVWGAAVTERLPAPCGDVRDGPGCRTTRSGDAFAPHCHDAAWAVLAGLLALAPPALCAARAARRRRLRRRDRRVEQRALQRTGQAALAALAGHTVPRAELRLLDKLGGGTYGVVRRAVLRRARATLAVAAKAPRADAPPGATAELLREAALLATLRHEHVVRFAGVCLEEGPLVLMEHAFHGDLRRYLRARRPLAERARAGLVAGEAAHVAAPALTRLAREAATALAYLASQRLVHRDVRAANCLVDENRSLKLADFGLARRLVEADSEEYLCRRRAMFPVLWMAPESLRGGVSTPASDVWALGVLVLELATLGERPFGAWPPPRVLRHVRAGGAPPLPRDTAPSTCGLTAACWQRDADRRPTAATLVEHLGRHPRAVKPALELLPGTDADADAVTDADPDAVTDADRDPGSDADTHVDADASAAPKTPDSGLYIDEWTVN